MNDTVSSLLSDNAGGFSTIRAICWLWTIMVGALLVHANWGSATFIDLPSNLYMATVALWAAKMGQRFAENASAPASPTPAPPVTPTP